MSDDYSSLMGMCEMEEAIKRMQKIAESRGSVISHCTYTPQDFTIDKTTLNGFCILIANGWVDAGYPNGTFFINQLLVDRLRTRETWKFIPDAKDFMGHFDTIYPNFKSSLSGGST